MSLYTIIPTLPGTDFGMIFFNNVPTGTYGTSATVNDLNSGLVGSGIGIGIGGRQSSPLTVTPPLPVYTAVLPALPPTETTNTIYIPWDSATMSLQTVIDSFYFEPKTVINATPITPTSYPYDLSSGVDKASYTNAPIAYMSQHSGKRWTPNY